MFVLLFLFVVGASVGSFLNVCIWRLPRGESIVQPPSHCPKCDTQLGALDLVPLLSQVFLGSRCLYCGAKISWRYFGIELLTGILWVLAGIWAGPLGLDGTTGTWTGDWVRLAQGLVFLSCLVVIFWVDYDTRLIQLEAVFLLGLSGVAADVWRTIQNPQLLSNGGFWPGHSLLPAPLPGSLWAMVVIATLLWIVREGFSWFYGKEALGFGDVILAGAIAAHLGWNGTLWTFSFCSVVVGALVGVALQIPRSIRAYRWAQRRGQKYLERASHASTAVANSTPAPDSETSTVVVSAFDPTVHSSDSVTAELASESTIENTASGEMPIAVSNAELIETVPVASGNETATHHETPAVPGDDSEIPMTPVEAPLEEQWDAQGEESEKFSVAQPTRELSDRERGEYWHNLAGAMARHAFRKAIPFGPMLAIGATLALLYGEPLNQAYVNWINPQPSAATSVPFEITVSAPQ